MSALKPADWQERGEGMMTPKQQRMLNAICGDLAAGLSWHGQRLTKDDWRHMVAGTMLGWRRACGRGRCAGRTPCCWGLGSTRATSRRRHDLRIRITPPQFL